MPEKDNFDKQESIKNPINDKQIENLGSVALESVISSTENAPSINKRDPSSEYEKNREANQKMGLGAFNEYDELSNWNPSPGEK